MVTIYNSHTAKGVISLRYKEVPNRTIDEVVLFYFPIGYLTRFLSYVRLYIQIRWLFCPVWIGHLCVL